ncbi:hypothetical protein [Thermogemmata fonticola]|uniref:Uncharacterized protein n=1 Tax=Thermogemmata fonticola TaxID=2755323 RepID=A0A7V8VCX3_9BACT|nr:hypothetical protein [Thermogemmata fonticola]MBA2225646.1 hypothetical protein [Thermogemmata fonticola]
MALRLLRPLPPGPAPAGTTPPLSLNVPPPPAVCQEIASAAEAFAQGPIPTTGLSGPAAIVTVGVLLAGGIGGISKESGEIDPARNADPAREADPASGSLPDRGAQRAVSTKRVSRMTVTLISPG